MARMYVVKCYALQYFHPIAAEIFIGFNHVYPARTLHGHSMSDARTSQRHGLDQICTEFARIRTDVHGRMAVAQTLHGHFMVPVSISVRDESSD